MIKMVGSTIQLFWIKDLVREKKMEMEMEKVDDPMVPNGWIV